MRRQITNQRPQRPQLTDQLVLLGNAQLFKVGKFVHAELKASSVPADLSSYAVGLVAAI
ncbi:hypothetical protein ACCUM_0265 [Candidatus Accumulibacter phosphatis]|uniref:Uncharacterized protein n=1 Tax=Candidatus Accumulibacter phosphatis TaxID=327160 RepID=A0A5S4EKY1_9PROT|nr:hypothetical protein ACCUM_0265 [Candidatus Accumulibacter phosphatis]